MCVPHMPRPSETWRCFKDHHIAQCTCKLPEAYGDMKIMHVSYHYNANRFWVAYLDWFGQGTPDLDTAGILEKILYNSDMVWRLMREEINKTHADAYLPSHWPRRKRD